MSVRTPSTKTHSKPSGAVAEPVPPPDGQTSFTGQPSSPGWCESPASVESASAHTSAQASRIRLIGSPSVEVVEGRAGFAGRTAQVITRPDPDLVLFRSLADRGDFRALTDLCRERKFVAGDAGTAVRWAKDHAIVEAMQGHYLASTMEIGRAHV